MDSGGQKYVYVAWWELNYVGASEVRFRRHVSAAEEGQGPWTEAEQVLGTTTFPGPGFPPELTDLAIAAYGSEVYVAWTEQGAFTKVKVARSVDHGQTFPFVWTPADIAGTSYRQPDLVATDTHVWLARVAVGFSGSTGVEAVRLKPLPEIRAIVSYDTDPNKRANWPTLTAFGDTVVVAYDHCTDCNDPTTRHVYVGTCTADQVCTAALKASAGAPTPSVAPDLARHGGQLHLVWRAGSDIVYQRGGGPFAIGEWGDPTTRFTIAATSGLPERQSDYAVAACGYGVAVAYKTAPNSPPFSRRNTHNGQPGSWLAPESLDSFANDVDVSVDARHEASGEKGNVLQYAYSTANGGPLGIMHRRIPTEERQRQATLFTDITVGQGQAAVMGQLLFQPRVFLFGGEVPGTTDRIWSYNPLNPSLPPLDTGHRLEMSVRYASAVWATTSFGDGAVIFWGDSGVSPNCVQFYDGQNPPACINLTDRRFRYGTSAVYDGTKYAYVFGGIDGAGNYLKDITRWDVRLAMEDPLPAGVCVPEIELPVPVAFTSAAWDPVEGAAYIFGGQQAGVPPTNSPRNYYGVMRFDPSTPCPGITTPAQMPCEPWDRCGPDEQTSVRPGPGTTAVYAGGTTILVAGGRHLYDPVLGGTFADSRYIYRFDTSTHTFTLKFVDLPACKAYGTAAWHAATGSMFYFAGYKDPGSCSAGGDQVVRYVLDTH